MLILSAISLVTILHTFIQYLDVSDDLGACTEEAAATAKPIAAGHRSSSAHPHSALSSPVKPQHSSRVTGVPPSGTALSPGARITTAAGSALPQQLVPHTQAETHEVLMNAVRRHAELHGAKVSTSLHNKVTHVVMRPEELSRAGKIKVGVCYCVCFLLFCGIDRWHTCEFNAAAYFTALSSLACTLFFISCFMFACDNIRSGCASCALWRCTTLRNAW